MHITSPKAISQIRQRESVVDTIITPTHLCCDNTVAENLIVVEEHSRRQLVPRAEDAALGHDVATDYVRIMLVTYKLTARAETFERLGEVLATAAEERKLSPNPFFTPPPGEPPSLAVVVDPEAHGFKIEDRVPEEESPNVLQRYFEHGIVLDFDRFTDHPPLHIVR